MFKRWTLFILLILLLAGCAGQSGGTYVWIDVPLNPTLLFEVAPVDIEGNEDSVPSRATACHSHFAAGSQGGQRSTGPCLFSLLFQTKPQCIPMLSYHTSTCFSAVAT